MLRTVLVTLFFGIVFFSAEAVGIQSWLHPEFLYILSFFLLTGLLTHRLVQLGFANNREKFVVFYLGSLVMRLVGAMVFLFVFFKLDTPLFERFLINFFVLYLFYAGFEMFGVRSNLRHFSDKRVKNSTQ